MANSRDLHYRLSPEEKKEANPLREMKQSEKARNEYFSQTPHCVREAWLESLMIGLGYMGDPEEYPLDRISRGNLARTHALCVALTDRNLAQEIRETCPGSM